jgi:type II secretory pathway component HofQ
MSRFGELSVNHNRVWQERVKVENKHYERSMQQLHADRVQRGPIAYGDGPIVTAPPRYKGFNAPTDAYQKEEYRGVDFLSREEAELERRKEGAHKGVYTKEDYAVTLNTRSTHKRIKERKQGEQIREDLSRDALRDKISSLAAQHKERPRAKDLSNSAGLRVTADQGLSYGKKKQFAM